MIYEDILRQILSESEPASDRRALFAAFRRIASHFVTAATLLGLLLILSMLLRWILP